VIDLYFDSGKFVYGHLKYSYCRQIDKYIFIIFRKSRGIYVLVGCDFGMIAASAVLTCRYTVRMVRLVSLERKWW